MDLVADTVAGPREEGAVLRSDGLEVAVVVGVAEVGLEGVVINVADRKLGGHPRRIHGLELEPRHSTRRVLGEGLIDGDGDLGARGHVARDEVLGKDPGG